MGEETQLISVGIDIGTTTTQMAVSCLEITNVMPGNRIPKTEISRKSLIYIGKIHFTPYLNRQCIDGASIRCIIAEEYEKAGLRPSDVDTGIVIITGESAKKENASEIINSLAEFAGNFVVAAVGPDLESIIAGKGSGAEKLSKKHHACIANIDIGGGTTNIALFNSGKCLGTACISVGCRLLEVDPLTHRISYIADPAQNVLNAIRCDGDKEYNSTEAEYKTIIKVLKTMVQCVEHVVFHEPLHSLDQDLIITNNLPPVTIEAVVFSGGVANYIYQPRRSEWWIHGDTGPLLAETFRHSRLFSELKVMKGQETIHATALGAGAHTINISGSTIFVTPGSLPLRNVPAVYPSTIVDSEGETYTWRCKAQKITDSLYATIALIVPELPNTRFSTIKKVAENIAREIFEIKGHPKVVIVQNDLAKVIGQTLFNLIGSFELICLDGIAVNDGDFLDIGNTLGQEEAVPIVVKTIAFL